MKIDPFFLGLKGGGRRQPFFFGHEVVYGFYFHYILLVGICRFLALGVPSVHGGATAPKPKQERKKEITPVDSQGV